MDVKDTLLAVSGVLGGSGGGSSATLVEKTITQNGTYDPADDSADGYSPVVANVPNTYAAADEGKVVSNGALVSQTSATYEANGIYDTTTKNSVTVNVSGGSATLVTKSIAANGTYNASSDSADGYSSVTVNVPNTYAAGDEGKVVSNGALVAQTSDTYTANGTYDTTTKNSVTVNVSGGIPTVLEEKDVNFYDYDGTLVYSYTAADFDNLTELPANPSHTELVAQGWNWTLAEAKAYVANHGGLDIGQQYDIAGTDPDAAVLIVDFVLPDGYTNPSTYPFFLGDIDIDWCDGAHSTGRNDFGTPGNILFSHNYATAGAHRMIITVTQDVRAPGVWGLWAHGSYDTSSTYSRLLCGADNGQAVDDPRYRNAITDVKIGHRCGIYSGAFGDCRNLKSVSVPDTLVSWADGQYSVSGSTIFGRAFYLCPSLRFVTIPECVDTIESEAFFTNPSITHISLPNGVTSMGDYAFSNCIGLKRLCIPDTCTSIGTYAFQNCEDIQKTYFSNSLANIPTAMCYGCSNTEEVIIPNSVTSINTQAFFLHYSLQRLRFEPQTPPTLLGRSTTVAFYQAPRFCGIEVPYGGLAAYLTASYYPSPSTHTYLGYATYTNGDTLPTQDSTEVYNVTWYATKSDAIAGTNAITTGNGSEIYCTYAAAT